MGEKKKKSFELGFFFRHEFKEQLRRMQTVAQVMEVLDAASDYVMTDNYSIQDPFSDLAFSAWKPCLKYEKETYLQVCEQNKINRQKREEKKIKKQQPELFKEEAASEGENKWRYIPLRLFGVNTFHTRTKKMHELYGNIFQTICEKKQLMVQEYTLNMFWPANLKTRNSMLY